MLACPLLKLDKLLDAAFPTVLYLSIKLYYNTLWFVTYFLTCI